MLVGWFDIGLHQYVPPKGRLLPSSTIDYTDEISKVAEEIGFQFEVRGDVLIIWGCLPPRKVGGLYRSSGGADGAEMEVQIPHDFPVFHRKF